MTRRQKWAWLAVFVVCGCQPEPGARISTAGFAMVGVPTLSQNDPRWSGDELRACPLGYRIGGWGCALTASAMVYNYYSPGFTDPGRLNRVVGYSDCSIAWGTAAPNGVRAVALPRHTPWNPGRAIASLEAGHPIIAKTPFVGSGKDHWVVIVGRTADGDFLVNDPWDGRQKSLRESGLGGPLSMALFEGPLGDVPDRARTGYVWQQAALNRRPDTATSDGVLTVAPGDDVDLVVDFENQGDRAWSGDRSSDDYVELRAVRDGADEARPQSSWLCHAHWLDGGPQDDGDCIRVVKPDTTPVGPGQVARFTFHGRIPADATPSDREVQVYFRPHHNMEGFAGDAGCTTPSAGKARLNQAARRGGLCAMSILASGPDEQDRVGRPLWQSTAAVMTLAATPGA